MNEPQYIEPSPTAEEVEEELDRAYALLDKVRGYRAEAQAIDNANEDPEATGNEEELERTEGLENRLLEALAILENLPSSKVDPGKRKQLFDKTVAIIDEEEGLLDDVWPHGPNRN